MKLLANALLATTLLSSLSIAGARAVTDAARPASFNSDVFGTADAPLFATNLGDVDRSTQIKLMLTLPLRDAKGAEEFARQVSDPGSRFYGQFIKPQEFGARFGASADDYAAVLKWAHESGLTVSKLSTARTMVTLKGDAATIQRLFGTHLASFTTKSGKVGFAPTVLPVLPAALAGKVSGVIGLSDGKVAPTLYHPLTAEMHLLASPANTGVLGAFSPSDLRTLYRLPIPLTTHAPQSVAIFEQGGYEKNDITVYKNRYGLPDVPITNIGVDGSGTGDVPGVDIESDIDIDMAIGVNPQLAAVYVYEDAVDPFPLAVIDALTAMADDDTANTVSISYGFDEAFAGNGAERGVKQVAMQMAAQGQTIFVSAGDGGAYGDEPPTYNASFPCSDPFVTCVGGTTLFTYDGLYGGEETWNLLGLGEGATGGGVSSFFPLPSYQHPYGYDVTTGNGGSSTHRNVPDVAAVGNPATGISVYNKLNGGWLVYGGTSVSSPIWAGFSSVLSAAREGAGLTPLGFFNPLVYKLGVFGAYGSRDVYDGTNGNSTIYGNPGYSAGYGYDNTTGWGSINVTHYAYSVLTDTRMAGTKPAAVRTVKVQPSETGVHVSWTPAANALGYYVTIISGDGSQVVGGATTTFDQVDVTGLTASTPYLLVVYSENNSGSTPIGNDLEFMTHSH